MKLKIEAGIGGKEVPRIYRLAWVEPRRRVGIYYPAPLHLLMWAWRELAYRVRLMIDAPSKECADAKAAAHEHFERQRLAEEYAHGYITGWRECFEVCLESVEAEIAGAAGIKTGGDVVDFTPRLGGKPS